MTNSNFIKTFFLTIIAIASLYILLVCLVNPQQTAPLKLSKKYDEFHDNFLLRKADLIKKGDFETLILGSSTSESFSVQEVNHIFKTTSFHGSIGGGNTASRYVLFKKSLEHFSNLKRIVYVADFYEFNQGKAPDVLAYNQDLACEINVEGILPPTINYLKYLFSHQLIESVFSVFKRSQKGYISPLLADGSTATSMILSTVQTSESFKEKISPQNKKKLMEEILENNQTYSRSVLANFEQLDQGVKALFKSLTEEAAKKNIQVYFILAPYHTTFKKMLISNEKIETRYGEWVEFMKSLHNGKTTFVYSDSLESVIATDPESAVWRDGIHFNNYAASYYLNEISKVSEND